MTVIHYNSVNVQDRNWELLSNYNVDFKKNESFEKYFSPNEVLADDRRSATPHETGTVRKNYMLLPWN